MSSTALHIAWILGPYYVVAGLFILSNLDGAVKMIAGLKKSLTPHGILFRGAMSFLVGMTILSFYREWTAGYEVIITISGWLAVLKGLFLFFNPKVILDKKYSRNTITVMGVVILLFGVILSNAAFGII
jgi:hypothetical protein